MKNIVSLIFKYLHPLLGISPEKQQNQSQRLIFKDCLVSVICGIGLTSQKGSESFQERDLPSVGPEVSTCLEVEGGGARVAQRNSEVCCNASFL